MSGRALARPQHTEVNHEVQHPAQARGPRQHHQPRRRRAFTSVAEGELVSILLTATFCDQFYRSGDAIAARVK